MKQQIENKLTALVNNANSKSMPNLQAKFEEFRGNLNLLWGFVAANPTLLNNIAPLVMASLNRFEFNLNQPVATRPSEEKLLDELKESQKLIMQSNQLWNQVIENNKKQLSANQQQTKAAFDKEMNEQRQIFLAHNHQLSSWHLREYNKRLALYLNKNFKIAIPQNLATKPQANSSQQKSQKPSRGLSMLGDFFKLISSPDSTNKESTFKSFLGGLISLISGVFSSIIGAIFGKDASKQFKGVANQAFDGVNQAMGGDMDLEVDDSLFTSNHHNATAANDNAQRSFADEIRHIQKTGSGFKPKANGLGGDPKEYMPGSFRPGGQNPAAPVKNPHDKPKNPGKGAHRPAKNKSRHNHKPRPLGK